MSYSYFIDLRSALSPEAIRRLLEARLPEPAAGRPWLVDLRIHVEDDPVELESIREWLGFEPTARIALYINTRAMTEEVNSNDIQFDAAMALIARTRSDGGELLYYSEGGGDLLRCVDGRVFLNSRVREEFWEHVDPVTGTTFLSRVSVPYEWRDFEAQPVVPRRSAEATA